MLILRSFLCSVFPLSLSCIKSWLQGITTVALDFRKKKFPGEATLGQLHQAEVACHLWRLAVLVRQNYLACTSIGNSLAPRGRLDQRLWRALPDNAATGLQKKIFSLYQSRVILSHQEHICTALGHSSPLFLQGGPMLLIDTMATQHMQES